MGEQRVLQRQGKNKTLRDMVVVVEGGAAASQGKPGEGERVRAAGTK